MKPIDFIHDLASTDIPDEARYHATRALYDTLGVAAAAIKTDNSRILRDFATTFFGAPDGQQAQLMFDGRSTSLPGAGFANSGSIDSLDAHDGLNEAKGHMGVVVIPALFAMAGDGTKVSGREFMTRLVLGYEFASRAGLALHETVPDYHTSGAWNALAAAAVASRALKLDKEGTRHALGIAEYNGPRSQMMRCIDYPTMVKDGATWGGFTGISAGLLAQMGHTGAPALTVEREDAASFWLDLGHKWYVTRQYVKPYPVCRWAQPAIAAALELVDGLDIDAIDTMAIETFHEAKRLPLAEPANTEEAQYSIKFAVAAAMVRGRVGVDEVAGSGLTDPAILQLANKIEITESDQANAEFPAARMARAIITLKNGQTLQTGIVRSAGDPDDPLSDDDMMAKFHSLADPQLGETRAQDLLDACLNLWNADDVSELASLVMPPTLRD